MGFFAGYALGVWTTIKAVVEIGKEFIEIDYDLVQDAIFNYKNQIMICYG